MKGKAAMPLLVMILCCHLAQSALITWKHWPKHWPEDEKDKRIVGVRIFPIRIVPIGILPIQTFFIPEKFFLPDILPMTHRSYLTFFLQHIVPT